MKDSFVLCTGRYYSRDVLSVMGTEKIEHSPFISTLLGVKEDSKKGLDPEA